MVIILRQSIATLLILLQLVAPLLHAHSGMELTNNSVHLPGLEVIDNDFSGSEMLEPISQNETGGVVIDICTGIKLVADIISIDPETAFIFEDTAFLPSLQPPSELIAFWLNTFHPRPTDRANASRAPPHLIR